MRCVCVTTANRLRVNVCVCVCLQRATIMDDDEEVCFTSDAACNDSMRDAVERESVCVCVCVYATERKR